MYCSQCGTPAEAHFKFCSKCGFDLSSAATASQPQVPAVAPRNMDSHVTALGWLFMVGGVLTGIGGFFLVLLGRVLPGFPLERFPDFPRDLPFDVTAVAGAAIMAVGLLTIAIGVGTFAAGYSLLQYKPWARVAAIVFGILAMFHFPLGTALGIYALWVLLSERGREFYERKAGPEGAV